MDWLDLSCFFEEYFQIDGKSVYTLHELNKFINVIEASYKQDSTATPLFLYPQWSPILLSLSLVQWCKLHNYREFFSSKLYLSSCKDELGMLIFNSILEGLILSEFLI